MSFIFFLLLSSLSPILPPAEAIRCRTSCGIIPIQYPFGIDDGCGSPRYRRLLHCSNSSLLELRTPSGRYQVRSISYSDPHIVVSDHYMWSCEDGDKFRPNRPFSLDTSTDFTLSSLNDYLFFNCSKKDVIMEPKPVFCDRSPDKCDSICDSSSYLCRHLPNCSIPLLGISCCSYYPKAPESLKLMLEHCASYTSVYWRTKNAGDGQVPDYGIRVEFNLPASPECLHCQRSGGACGFNSESQEFCICADKNSTTYCNDYRSQTNRRLMTALAGVLTAGVCAFGFGLWVWSKVKSNKPVTCGVQTNENRLF